LNGEELAADLRAEADRLHDEMRRLQDQADELLNAADDLDPPPAARGDAAKASSYAATGWSRSLASMPGWREFSTRSS
jgi:hypothetical protein